VAGARGGQSLKPTHVGASQRGDVAAQNRVDALDARPVEKLDEIRKNGKNDSAGGACVESLASFAKGTFEHFDPGSLASGGKDLAASFASSALRAVT
jgi:hypothetical protein